MEEIYFFNWLKDKRLIIILIKARKPLFYPCVNRTCVKLLRKMLLQANDRWHMRII